MTLELSEILSIALAIGIAAAIHGYGGFGYGYISIAFFSLLSLNIVSASLILTLVSFPVAALLAYIDGQRNPINWRILGIVSLGFLPMVPVGVLFVVAYGQTDLFRIAFGTVLIIFSVYNVGFSQKRLPIPFWSGALFGLAGGFLGGAIVSGGPPVVIYSYSQTDDPREMKGTMQVIFLLASLVRLASLRIIEGPGSGGYYVEAAVISLPILLLLWIGHRISLKTSILHFRRVVSIVLLGFGLYLILGSIR